MTAGFGAPDGRTPSRIGARVRAARTAATLSVEQLAQRCGRRPAEIEELEDGFLLPDIRLLYDLARVVQVPPGRLLPDSTDRPAAQLRLPLTSQPDAPVVRILNHGSTQTYLFDLGPGDSDGGFCAHPGQELLIVLGGDVVCTEDGHPDQVICAHQSRIINTGRPHGVRATHNGPAQFLLICSD